MKHRILSIFLLLLTFFAYAQEAADTTYTAEGSGWSMQTKFWMLAIFVIVSIIAVLRTFRGKADV